MISFQKILLSYFSAFLKACPQLPKKSSQAFRLPIQHNILYTNRHKSCCPKIMQKRSISINQSPQLQNTARQMPGSFFHISFKKYKWYNKPIYCSYKQHFHMQQKRYLRKNKTTKNDYPFCITFSKLKSQYSITD